MSIGSGTRLAGEVGDKFGLSAPSALGGGVFGAAMTAPSVPPGGVKGATPSASSVPSALGGGVEGAATSASLVPSALGGGVEGAATPDPVAAPTPSATGAAAISSLCASMYLLPIIRSAIG